MAKIERRGTVYLDEIGETVEVRTHKDGRITVVGPSLGSPSNATIFFGYQKWDDCLTAIIDRYKGVPA